MYRLLIVDDEDIITDGLYEVFSQYKPEQLDVCKAYSGKEALEWLQRTRIDIILTDIAMPGMNGLDLIEEVQTYWPKCKVIFLTGHSNFEYTYRAIQMSDVRYLLKTEGYDKVIDTVEEVIQEIKRGNLERTLLEQSREQVYAYQFMAQGEFLRHLLQMSEVVCSDPDVVVKEFEHSKISLDPNRDVLIVLGRLTYPKGMTYTEKGEILSLVRNAWTYHFSGEIASVEIVDRHGDILWFVQPTINNDEKVENHVYSFLEGTLELIQEDIQMKEQLAVSFTINGKMCPWKHVTQQYERLRKLQQLKIGEGIPVILWDYAEEGDSNEDNECYVNSYKVDVLTAHLDANRVMEFLEELDHIIHLQQTNGDINQTIEAYYSIALILYSYINRMDWHGKIHNSEKLLNLDAHVSMKVAFTYLRTIARNIFQHNQADNRNRAAYVIDSICEYIENHLSEDLSLVRLAEIHYFNPSYLSYFFKQERGINLSEYIEKCRVRKAKKLLESQELKIREVGEAVGYSTAHSFTRLFKKVTGMTPKEYRDRLFIKS